MENRFTFRDLIFTLLFLVLIVSLWFKIKQDDRQWELTQRLSQKLDDQTRDMADIRRTLREGLSVYVAPDGLAPSTTQQTVNGGNGGHGSVEPTTRPADVFASLRAVRARPDFADGDWLVDVFGVQPPTLTPLVAQDLYAVVIEARVIEGLATRDPDTFGWLPLLATSWKTVDNGAAWLPYVARRKAQPLTEEEIRKEDNYPEKDAAAQADYVRRRLAEGRQEIDIGAEEACPPATTITFKLREGVRFSDGEPFTADDVVFTFQWIMNKKVAAQRDRSAFIEVKDVRKISDYEVEFSYKRPYFESFALAAEMGVMPRHFYEKYDPEKFNQSTGLLMGTGPYRLESPTDWTPGQPIELVRNDRYWGVPSPLDRLVYKVIQTEPAQMTEFLNGKLDIFAADPDQYQALLKNPEVMARTEQRTYWNIRSGYSYIAWNQNRKGKATRFADPKVRLAMTLLTDRQRICDSIFLGYAKVASGPFNELSDQHDKNITPWPHDVDKARALLKEAGYEDKVIGHSRMLQYAFVGVGLAVALILGLLLKKVPLGTRCGLVGLVLVAVVVVVIKFIPAAEVHEGLLRGPDGEPFRFSLVYPAKTDIYQRVALLLKDCFAEGGIVVDLDPCDWPILTKKLTERDFDAISLAWSGSIENDIFQMFHSSQIEDNADNFMSYRSAKLDDLITRARGCLDEAKRMELWRQCHAVIHQDQPYTFLIRREALLFSDKRIHNIREARAGLNYVALWNYPLEWYVPKAQQVYGK